MRRVDAYTWRGLACGTRRVCRARELQTSCVRARRMGEDRSIRVHERSIYPLPRFADACAAAVGSARRAPYGAFAIAARRATAAARRRSAPSRIWVTAGTRADHPDRGGSGRPAGRESLNARQDHVPQGSFSTRNGPGRRRFRDPAEGMFQWNPPASPPPSFGAVQGCRGQVLAPCRLAIVACLPRSTRADCCAARGASHRCRLPCSIRRGPASARPGRHIASAERTHSACRSARDPATRRGADRGELVPSRSFRSRGSSVDRWHGLARALRGGDRRAARGAHRRGVQVGMGPALRRTAEDVARTARRSAHL